MQRDRGYGTSVTHAGAFDPLDGLSGGGRGGRGGVASRSDSCRCHRLSPQAKFINKVFVCVCVCGKAGVCTDVVFGMKLSYTADEVWRTCETETSSRNLGQI